MAPTTKSKRTRHEYSILESRNLLAGDTICAGDGDNMIVARLNAADTTLVDIEVDGIVVQSFDINDATSIVINAGLGNDTFLLDYSNGAPETLGGYEYIGGDGTDRFETNTTTGDVYIFGLGADSGGILDNFLRFDGVEAFTAGDGQDLFTFRSVNSSISVDGGDGNDVFRLGSTTPNFFAGNLELLNGDISIEGGTGQNRILVGGRGGSGLDLTITENAITGHNQDFGIFYASDGGSFSNADGSIGGVTIFGANFADDVFNVDTFLESNTLKLRGSGGDDNFRVSSQVLGDVILDTGLGFDTADIFLAGSGDRQIFVEGDGGRFNNRSNTNIFGTAQDDQFSITGEDFTFGDEFIRSQNFFSLSGGNGDDNFLIESDLFLRLAGNAGNDTFITTEAGATRNGAFRVTGGFGDDVFDLTAAQGTFIGGAGNDVFFGTQADFGQLVLDGRDGSDEYDIELQSQGFRVEVRDFGEDDGDVDNLIYRIVDPTELIDIAVNSLAVNFGNGFRPNGFRGVESFTLFTGDSDDTIGLSGFLPNFTLNTGDGDDLIQIGSFRTADFPLFSSVELDAGAGFNRIVVGEFASDGNEVRIDVDESGAVPVTTIESGVEQVISVRAISTGGLFASADGSTGGIAVRSDRDNLDSVFLVNGLLEDNTFGIAGIGGTFVIGSEAFGDVIVGPLQEATINIFESGNDRTVNATSDTGLVLNNTINIVGSDEAEQFIVANNFFSWGSTGNVVFDAGTTFNIIGNGGDDQFQVGATLAGVTTRLFGGDGDDIFVTGGNLNSLDGAIAVFGGAGEDSFVVDDSLAVSNYNYHIDTNFIAAISGPNNLLRPDFAGITFDNEQLENLTLLASSGNNLVRVRPSSTDNRNIVGGIGEDAISLISQPNDGQQLNLTGPNSGFWTFELPFLDLVFEDFEIRHAD